MISSLSSVYWITKDFTRRVLGNPTLNSGSALRGGTEFELVPMAVARLEVDEVLDYVIPEKQLEAATIVVTAAANAEVDELLRKPSGFQHVIPHILQHCLDSLNKVDVWCVVWYEDSDCIVNRDRTFTN